ncbi:type II toxin-antitoxin system VapC family toxin [Streptomyces sp. NPDC048419]|uniref:type II toxin-antitoxin system VapC family toxin n=1 Tax=Streptomyces sp. NPDC048419 TaxID=3365547 RepID=UPI003720C8E0
MAKGQGGQRSSTADRKWINRPAVSRPEAIFPAGSFSLSQRSRSRGGGVKVYAPTLIDYEIQSALLGMQRGGKLSEQQGTKAIADFTALPLDTLALWERVRVLHADLSAYDAPYVALAESLGIPLVTCDARIKRSGAATCAVEVFGSN